MALINASAAFDAGQATLELQRQTISKLIGI